jgi:CheY-like chemotaxis protein
MTALNILVVDDDPDLAESIAEALSMAGHAVRIAGNGAEAVQHYSETKYDLGFVDIRMPVMNGVDCFFAVRQRYPDAKIVLMTGFKEAAVERALAAGALGLLQKPFRMEEVIRIARQNS